MKKLAFLFAATILSLSSCTKDDNNNDGTNGGSNGGGTKLVQSVLTTPQPTGSPSEVSYTYDGTKVATSSSSSTTKTVYTYDKDVLSKTENKTNNATTQYTLYTYDKGDVKTATTFAVVPGKSDDKTSSVEYTYDENAKTRKSVTTNFSAGVGTVSTTVTVDTFDAKHLVSSVATTTVDDKNYTVVSIAYKYDDKNNPMVNVTGQPANIVKGSNNILSQETTTVNTVNAVSSPATSTLVTNQYEYDAAGFPTVVSNYSAGNLSNKNKYFYNN